MFERYTEKARRVIFFARYEASHFGSPYIETEHLLLGLLRDNPQLVYLLPGGSHESIRAKVEANTLRHPAVSVSVDLPLSNEGKRALAYAAEEAERLGHRHIGSEHFADGIAPREKQLGGCTITGMWLVVAKGPRALHGNGHHRDRDGTSVSDRQRTHSNTRVAWPVEVIRERVSRLRQFNWYWEKRPWKARDLAVRNDGKISLNLQLVTDSADFALRPAAWKKDSCAICHWELYESNDPDHGSGYTNERDWLCNECYQKFLQGPDYFEDSFAEIS